MSHNASNMKTLGELIGTLEGDLAKVLNALLSSAASIAVSLRSASSDPTSAKSTNSFGDQQLQVDVIADEIIEKSLKETNVVRVSSSEENATENILCEEGTLSVAYDPLDGSSILPTNFAVGTIAGVWRAPTFVGTSGEKVTAALAVVYGPRTTVFIAARGWGRGVTEGQLREDGEWDIVRCVREIGDGKLFAPANLRSTADNVGYRNLVEWYISQRYTLRYTGGMVPDVTQIFVKGFGVFVSPVSPRAAAKLRLAYEVMPMAFLMVQGGGCSSDGRASVLTRTIASCGELTGVCLGSASEVSRFEEFCKAGGEGGAAQGEGGAAQGDGDGDGDGDGAGARA